MIKEATGFGQTVDEAKEKAIESLNAPEDADIQFEVIATPKKKTLGLFGGRLAEVKVFIELPDPKPQKPLKKNTQNQTVKKEKPNKPEKPKVSVQKAEKPEEKYGEAVDASEVSPDSKEGKAVIYVRSILEKLGCTNIEIKVAKNDNGALISLDGEGLGVVIGHRGETLDSLQYLAGIAANNGGGFFKIALNIGNYREKREETLTALANRVAAQVLRTGKSRSLEPMNPYERRIIHTAIQGIEGVKSGSFGEGNSRRVVIGPEGEDIRPPRRDDRRRSGGRRRPSSKPQVSSTPAREPKKDSDTPLYGKIH